MQLIEKQMLQAINTGSNWRKDNTEVVHVNGIAQVYLHGHHIASIYGDVEPNLATLAAWPTATTKSRLRALGVDVYTKNHITYVDGEAVA